jgi:hypothetical protein
MVDRVEGHHSFGEQQVLVPDHGAVSSGRYFAIVIQSVMKIARTITPNRMNCTAPWSIKRGVSAASAAKAASIVSS